MAINKKILLLFSDISTAQLLNKHLLGTAGYEVIVTSNQKEAKANIKLNHPNLLILSDTNKESDSIELINFLLKEDPFLPIIYFSDKASAVSSENFIHLGYVEIINTPFKKEKIQTAITLGLQRNENWLNWLNNRREGNNQISELLEIVSHDLRTPLTSIFGYIDLIERVGELNAEQKKYIEKVNSSASNINSMIDELLISRKVDGGSGKKKEVLSLYPIIQNSVDGLLIQAENRNQNLEISLDNKLPKVQGNPVHLRQVMDNLIGNAIKFTSEGGAVFVSAKYEKGFVTVTFKDNGVGIPKEDYSKIFNKYYRVSNDNHVAPGTGLGLTIVKSIVNDHHGQITVESEIGKGTVFTVLLPTTH